MYGREYADKYVHEYADEKTKPEHLLSPALLSSACSMLATNSPTGRRICVTFDFSVFSNVSAQLLRKL